MTRFKPGRVAPICDSSGQDDYWSFLDHSWPAPGLHSNTLSQKQMKKINSESMKRYKASIPQCSVLTLAPLCSSAGAHLRKHLKGGWFKHDSCQVEWGSFFSQQRQTQVISEWEASQSHKMRVSKSRTNRNQPTVAYCPKLRRLEF